MLIPEIDEVITADLPWVKKDKSIAPKAFSGLVRQLATRKFDGGIMLTVYSQSSLPAALLLWMAGVPLRLGYCRENPYDLLNYWLPDQEPYTLIRHQVERELYLLKYIGIDTEDRALKLSCPVESISSVEEQLDYLGIGKDQPYFIFHAGVSEEKRKFPKEKWVKLARETIEHYNLPVLFTGSDAEQGLTQYLQEKTGKGSYSLGGRFTFPEFAALIARAKLLVSLNTAAVHLAAGMNTPVIVLYTHTNPQHIPWNVKGGCLNIVSPTAWKAKTQ
jgi:ADP-heptose:LPS heptosyltransferase